MTALFSPELIKAMRDEYPSPIAHAYAFARSAKDDMARHKELLDLVATTISYMARIAWAECRHKGGVPIELVRVVHKVRSPSEGNWLELLRSANNVDPASSLNFCIMEKIHPSFTPAITEWVGVWSHVTGSLSKGLSPDVIKPLWGEVSKGPRGKVTLDGFLSAVIGCRNHFAHPEESKDRPYRYPKAEIVPWLNARLESALSEFLARPSIQRGLVQHCWATSVPHAAVTFKRVDGNRSYILAMELQKGTHPDKDGFEFKSEQEIDSPLSCLVSREDNRQTVVFERENLWPTLSEEEKGAVAQSNSAAEEAPAPIVAASLLDSSAVSASPEALRYAAKVRAYFLNDGVIDEQERRRLVEFAEFAELAEDEASAIEEMVREEPAVTARIDAFRQAAEQQSLEAHAGTKAATEVRADVPDSPADTGGEVVIVAAGAGYPFYLKSSAYVCQPGRSFRDGLTHMGFYADSEIKAEIARILYVEDDVVFSEENSAIRAQSQNPNDKRVAEVIREAWKYEKGSDRRTKGWKVFLLSGPTASETIRLGAPVKNTKRTASGTRAWGFTLNQTYVSLAALARNPATTDELDAPLATALSLDISSFGNHPPRHLLAIVAQSGGVYRPESASVEFQSDASRQAASDLLIAEGLTLPEARQKTLIASLVNSLTSGRQWLNKGEILKAVGMTEDEWEVIRREARHAGAVISHGPSFGMRYGLPGWPPPATAQAVEAEPDEETDDEPDDGAAEEWRPGPGVGSFTLARVGRDDLQPYLRDVLGHGNLRKINRAVEQKGRMLVQNAFPELDRAAERAFLAELTFAHARDLGVEPVLARILGIDAEAVATVLAGGGKTLLRTSFPQLLSE